MYLGCLCSLPDYYFHNYRIHRPLEVTESSSKAASKPNNKTNIKIQIFDEIIKTQK